MPEPFRECKLLILDLDGVLTDGTLQIDSRGGEIKRFDVRDGIAIKWFQELGKTVAIISGRESPAAAARAADMGVKHCRFGHAEKGPAYRALKEELGVEDAAICCVGDDLLDAPMLQACGFPATVANARPEIKAIAAYVAQSSGGSGGVREIIELILRREGLWDRVLEKYGIDPK
jgi:3-deoxy-D-manno-octulosonate 8-phosphate phosphatase (KDO 8-P phosphatase)